MRLLYSKDHNVIISRLRRKLRLLKKTTDLLVHEGLDIDDINAYCETNNLLLPDEMKIWLCLCNGITGGKREIPVCFGDIYGILKKQIRFGASDLIQDLSIHPYWQNLGYIPIGTDGCGSVYLLIPYVIGNCVKHPVVFFDHADSHEYTCDTPSYVIASGFLTFVDRLLLKELCIRRFLNFDTNMPFSEKITTKHDPYILRFKLKKLWEDTCTCPETLK
jgi:hypothetical protein